MVTHNSKSDLPLAALLEHMHKMVEINPTNIKGGCQSGRNNSKSDLPLMSSKQSETSESSESSVSSNLPVVRVITVSHVKKGISANADPH